MWTFFLKDCCLWVFAVSTYWHSSGPQRWPVEFWPDADLWSNVCISGIALMPGCTNVQINITLLQNVYAS